MKQLLQSLNTGLIELAGAPAPVVGRGRVLIQTRRRVASNGGHAELVCVPRNLCAKIPEGVADDAAAFTVLGAIALQGLRLAEPTLGERFVVFGAGLLGLLTVQLLRAGRCETMAVDLNAERLALAAEFGARTVNPAAGGDACAAAESWTGGVGVDGAIITASAKGDSIVHQAAQACRKRGRIILVGVVDLSLRRRDFYEKELSFQPCVVLLAFGLLQRGSQARTPWSIGCTSTSTITAAPAFSTATASSAPLWPAA